MNSLPQTGTVELLQALSPHLDDEFVDQLFWRKRGRGRRPLLRPAQLFRVLLLNLLTPVHSFNLLVTLLRAHALLRNPPSESLLLRLAPVQTTFDFKTEF